MSGGGISNSATRIEAVKLQSSSLGVTVALMYGVTRVAGNMVWYGGFEAVPRTTTQGGKGGISISQTDFSYRADVIMALGHGYITSVPRVWRGKKLFEGGLSSTQVETATLIHTPTAIGAPGLMVPEAATFLDVISAVYASGGGDSENNYVLANGEDFTFTAGVFILLNENLVGLPISLQYQFTTGAVSQNALDSLGLTLRPGALLQAPWTGLANAGAQALGYSGLALLCGQGYDLGEGAQVENHTVEVVAPMAYHLGPAQPDVDLSLVVRDVLLNGRYGAAFPSLALGDWQAWSDWCVASSLLVSPCITQRQSAADVVRYGAELTNVGPVWSGGKLRMVPFGDSAITANGRTFTPDDSVVFALTDEEFLRPLTCEIKSPADRKNHTRVEFLDRANQYNVAIAEAKDQADIDANGLRTDDTMEAHWVCTADTARQVAQIRLQRSLYVVNTYTGELPWHFAFLEPMDLCTITDPGLGLLNTPVRVMTIDESESGDLSVTFEDYPAGVAGAVRYPAAEGSGFAPDYNAVPGNVDTPVIFEAPVERTSTGLEVYVAVRGLGPAWGGCGVWISLDEANYKRVATVQGPARYGTLAGPIASGALPVVTSGQLLSGSAADAGALQTLCWVGGASQEYLAYQTATLTAPGAYTLAGLVRGAYSTSPANAHAANDPFVRVDESIVSSGPLDLSLIGKTAKLKFTSFNLYRGGEQSLADVQAYPYTITGALAKLPPTQPTGLDYSLEPFGARLKCNKNPEPDVVGYEWRLGPAWASAAVLDKLGGTSFPLAVQVLGSFTAWVAAVDALGNVSEPASMAVMIAGPTIATLTAAVIGADLQLDYSANSGAFAVSSFAVRYGPDWATATEVGVYNVTRLVRRIDWTGSRRWWVAPIDARGNLGAPSSVDVSILAPGPVTGARSEVVDNNALLYWGAPVSGSLPVEKYEVRRGPAWVGGTQLGSNGNSTFTTYFEQQAGIYTYWIAAVDTAGTPGQPAAITASISQPPDYVLRADYNDDWAGITLVGMYQEDGRLYGPAFGETIQAHFETRGWATPDDQIGAGYPQFFAPSATTGYAERVLDYGTLLPTSGITATPTSSVLAGAVTLTVQISYKADAADPWIDATPDARQVQASNFRYIKVRMTCTSSSGNNLIEIQGLNIRLSGKLKADSGSGVAAAGDAVGTPVAFGVSFIDVQAIVVTPSGTTARYAIYNFTDVPNPTGFAVLLFDSAGNRVSGPFSWTARGY